MIDNKILTIGEDIRSINVANKRSLEKCLKFKLDEMI